MTAPLRITEAQETFLAYMSSWGPIGTDIAFSIEDAATDLGYRHRRSIYYLYYQLRDMGLAQMLKGEGYNGKTAFRCYARPEDCEVVIIARKGRAKGSTNPVQAGKPKKLKARARVVKAKPAPKPSRPKLISYVGCAGQPEWNRI
ncbi:hypothetical protein [Rhizobium mongolense]|uniref:hypothetical protein n=1 Tax=Rhizobium mongolense TaxID=57676 RepID=UPI0034A293D0